MRIQGNHSGVPPADKADEARQPAKAKSRGQARLQDSVEISDTARHLSSELTGKAGGAPSSIEMNGALPRPLAEIRERIRSDFYDNEEVLRRVAGRILDLMDNRS